MPAVSKKQQRFMASCLHNPKHEGECPDDRTAREFARTKRSSLPERKSAKRRKPKVKYPE